MPKSNQENQSSSKAKGISMSLSIQSDWEIKRIVKLDWINDKLIVGFYIQPKLFNLFFEEDIHNGSRNINCQNIETVWANKQTE